MMPYTHPEDTSPYSMPRQHAPRYRIPGGGPGRKCWCGHREGTHNDLGYCTVQTCGCQAAGGFGLPETHDSGSVAERDWHWWCDPCDVAEARVPEAEATGRAAAHNANEHDGSALAQSKRFNPEPDVSEESGRV